MPGYLQAGVLRPTVCGISTAADLRAVLPSSLFANGMTAYLPATGCLYLWDGASTLADDGSVSIRPNDLGAGVPGRWVLYSLQSAAPPALEQPPTAGSPGPAPVTPPPATPGT